MRPAWHSSRATIAMTGTRTQSKPRSAFLPILGVSQNRGVSECRGYHDEGCRSLLGADEFLDSAGDEWVLGSIFTPPWRGRAPRIIGTMQGENLETGNRMLDRE